MSEETENRAEEHLNLNFDPHFPPDLNKIEWLSKAMLEHPKADRYRMYLEDICGVTDDSQPVEQYDGTLGVNVAFVNEHQGPVGQLQWNDNLASIYTNPGVVSGIRWCSGTLISDDLFLTAGHCFHQNFNGPLQNGTSNPILPPEIATNMHVNFNYQVDSAGNLQLEQSFPISELVEHELGGLDYAIVRLVGNPGLTFGTTKVSTKDAIPGQMICIIGHPAGEPKRIEAGPVSLFQGDSIYYNDIDTLGGNSGSGLLLAQNGYLVGVHTNGGCDIPSVGYNHGVRISSLIAVSPTLQALSFKFISDVKFKFGYGGATSKFADDIGLIIDKPFNDQKFPGSDVRIFDWRTLVLPGARGPQSTRPFILATPHHSMTWAGQQTGTGLGRREMLAQYEVALAQLEQLLQQGLAETGVLEGQYQRLLAEYQALMSGQQ
jgi:V8-like Glu-specific endopeptidase